MRKYYSPTKDYAKHRVFHPFYALTKAIIRIFFPKNEFIWKTEKPDESEAAFFVCNHTKIYAPTYFLLQRPPIRTWTNYYFMFYKSCWHHLSTKVLKDLKAKWLLYPIALMLTPLIVWTIRATNSIPVFHANKDVLTTFKKSIETMESGVNQVIFPERTENRVNKYVYEFNSGFPIVAQMYYNETGKLMKFYPVYCAQNIHTFVVGDPITYDPTLPMKKQRNDICRYLEHKIEEMGDSLPPHEPVPYV